MSNAFSDANSLAELDEMFAKASSGVQVAPDQGVFSIMEANTLRENLQKDYDERYAELSQQSLEKLEKLRNLRNVRKRRGN